MASRISAETAAAVAMLFESEALALFRWASTLPGVRPSDAEDLVQTTFQQAAIEWEQRLCSLDRESCRKWLYSVLRNKAIDQWRKYGSRTSPVEQLGSVSLPLQVTDRDALRSIALELCWKKITMMPDVRQRVAFLKWSEEWSTAEIAEFLGVRSSTVRKHLKLARDELLAEVGPQVPFDDPGQNPGKGVAS